MPVRDRPTVVRSWLDLGPGQEVELHRGPLELRIAGDDAPMLGEAAVTLDWHRGLTIHVTSARLIPGMADRANILGLADDVHVVGTYLNTTAGEGGIASEFEGRVPSLEWGAGPVQRIRFDIGNFPKTVRSVQDPPWEGEVFRIRLRADGWLLLLDEVPDADHGREAVKRSGGGCVTHTAVLTRADGTAFDPTSDEVADLLHALHWLLSFAAAAWVPLLAPTGIGPDGSLRWGNWGSPRCSTPNSLRWMSIVRAGALSCLWPRWRQAWQSDDAHDVLRIGIPMYVEAALGGTVELAITTAFTALEVVAWHRLAERPGANHTRAQVRGMTAEARVRTMLQELNVPTAVPPDLGAAQQGFAAIGDPPDGVPEDGPFLVANLRNRIAHPRNTERISAIPDSVKIEVWQLALWYFELAVLHLCGFTGQYLAKSQRPESEWDVAVPPWVANP